MAPRTPCEIGRPAAAGNAHCSPVCARRQRRTSSTKNGLPSVSRWIARTTASGAALPGRHLDEAPDFGFAQAPQRHVPGAARQPAEDLGHRRLVPRLDLAIGADGEDAGVRQLVGDELEQAQRRQVGPVQIVEQRSAAVRCVAACARNVGGGVEQAQAGRFGIQRRRQRRARQRLAQLGHDLREVGEAGAERRGELLADARRAAAAG